MFNQLDSKFHLGTVLGACLDGFLFGACCRLPDEISASITGANQATNNVTTNQQNGGIEKPPFQTPSSADLIDSGELGSTSQNSDTVYSALIHKLKLPNFDTYYGQTTPAPITLPSPPPKLPPSPAFKMPSIILGNGTVISLDSMSLRPVGSKVGV